MEPVSAPTTGIASEQVQSTNALSPSPPNSHNFPEGPDQALTFGEIEAPAELIVSCRAESLDKGLSQEEIDLIHISLDQAKSRGQRLLVRFRLEETEEQLIKLFGQGNKALAVQVLAQKVRVMTEQFESIAPGGRRVGGILGVTPDAPSATDEAQPTPPSSLLQ